MNRNIKKFALDGEVGDDANFARIRLLYEKMIIELMREDGYVPVFGIGPYWATEYIVQENKYRFLSTVHGVYVGRRKAWMIQGITLDDRNILFPTPPTKSKGSSETAE